MYICVYLFFNNLNLLNVENMKKLNDITEF